MLDIDIYLLNFCNLKYTCSMGASGGGGCDALVNALHLNILLIIVIVIISY
jgi:hypothetical protein